MLKPSVIAFILFLFSFPFPSQCESVDFFGSMTERTPYDAKYRAVETYLASIPEVNPVLSSPSFSMQKQRIRRYLQIARNFTFQEEDLLSSGRRMDHWQLPQETEGLGSGDCEDLAIWLYCQLLDEGFYNIRLTIGLAGTEDKTMHAWVSWHERGEMYILDPSRKEGIYRSGQLGSVTYQPYYSYYFGRKWHHR